VVTAAALSALVSAVFAVVMAARYLRRRRPYQLAWTIGLAMFAAAATAGTFARMGGATAAEYRVFYLFGAILNVAWLALGTLFLLAPRIARWAVWVVLALTVLASVAVVASPVDLSAAVDTGKGFGESPLPRVLALIGSGIGSVILIGGALWSAWVFLRRRHEGRRALGRAGSSSGRTSWASLSSSSDSSWSDGPRRHLTNIAACSCSPALKSRGCSTWTRSATPSRARWPICPRAGPRCRRA
jgi:hypothetical protein